MTIRERLLAGLIALVLASAIVSSLLHRSPSTTIDADDALRCGEAVAKRIGFDATSSTVESETLVRFDGRREEAWRTTLASSGTALVVWYAHDGGAVMRAERIGPGGREGISRKDQRVVIEAGCR